jgi:hypothetical protein
MTNRTMSDPRHDTSTLSLACLAHMEQEEAMLQATLDSLRQVRAALLGRDLAELERAVERQVHTARAAEELRLRRAELRGQLAVRLGIDAQAVTLQKVAARLPGENGERLARCRERLKCMAAEIDRLNRGNAALVQHSLEFLHQFLLNVTGGAAVGDRYQPSGRVDRALCGSVFEGRA